MSKSFQVLATSPSLRTTLSPVYIGTIVAAMQVNVVFVYPSFTNASSPWSLFGITNLQVVIYYMKYPKDWWVHRYLVIITSPEFDFVHWSSVDRLGYCGESESSHSPHSWRLPGFLIHFMLLLTMHALYYYLINLFGYYVGLDHVVW